MPIVRPFGPVAGRRGPPVTPTERQRDRKACGICRCGRERICPQSTTFGRICLVKHRIGEARRRGGGLWVKGGPGPRPRVKVPGWMVAEIWEG